MKQNSLNELSKPSKSDKIVPTKSLAPCVKVPLNFLLSKILIVLALHLNKLYMYQVSSLFSIYTDPTPTCHRAREEDSLKTSYVQQHTHTKKKKQEVSLKKIIVEDYRAVGFLNDGIQSSNLLLLLFFIDFKQW